MPKIVCISDTHSQLSKVEIPDGDLLIHAGDLTWKGEISEVNKELSILSQKCNNFKKIVLICGNHDGLGEWNPDLMKEMCQDFGIIYLNDTSTEFEGLNIFGSPYTPEFGHWHFMYDRGKSSRWGIIPDNTDILVTHGPPMGILDVVKKYSNYKNAFIEENVGCYDLKERVKELKQLKLHIFGHIHSQYGSVKIENTTFANASTCTERYKPTNSPFIFDI